MKKTVYAYFKDGFLTQAETDRIFETEADFQDFAKGEIERLKANNIIARDFVFICTINYKLK